MQGLADDPDERSITITVAKREYQGGALSAVRINCEITY